jgi:prepilin signal peptidase PulO-like enzyme (type II secretory pathway)
MRRRCRSCGHAVSPNSAWCPACGAKLFSLAPLPLLLVLIAVVLLILICVALAVWTLDR